MNIQTLGIAGRNVRMQCGLWVLLRPFLIEKLVLMYILPNPYEIYYKNLVPLTLHSWTEVSRTRPCFSFHWSLTKSVFMFFSACKVYNENKISRDRRRSQYHNSGLFTPPVKNWRATTTNNDVTERSVVGVTAKQYRSHFNSKSITADT